MDAHQLLIYPLITLVTLLHYNAPLKLIVKPDNIIALHTQVSVHVVDTAAITPATNGTLVSVTPLVFNCSLTIVSIGHSNRSHYQQQLASGVGAGSVIPLPCGSLAIAGHYRVLVESLRTDRGAHWPLRSAVFSVLWPPLLVRLPVHATVRSAPLVAHVRVTLSVCRPLHAVPPVTARLYRISGRHNNSATCRRPASTSVAVFSEPVQHVLARAHDLRIECHRLEQSGVYQLLLVTDTDSQLTSSDHSVVGCSNLLHVAGNPRVQLHVRGEQGAGVFPCRAGVQVYYSRPECSSHSRDSVRVYALLHEPVASATPPVTRHYVGEHLLSENNSALTLPCSMFRQRYASYCFAYTSVTRGGGATHTLASQCIPTMLRPVVRDGGFGLWSSWSECGPGCGTDQFQVRYRLCDSPTPRNHGKFCSGPRVESRQCSSVLCSHANRTLVSQLSASAALDESRACLCGCHVAITTVESRTLVFDVSTRSADNCSRAVWKFETRVGWVLQVRPLHIQLERTSYRLQLRDGWHETHQLLAQLPDVHAPLVVTSSSERLLLEYEMLMLSAGRPDDGFILTVSAKNRTIHRIARSSGLVAPSIISELLLSAVFIGCVVVAIIVMAVYHGFKMISHSRLPVESSASSCQSLLEVLEDQKTTSAAAAPSIEMVRLNSELSSDRQRRRSPISRTSADTETNSNSNSGSNSGHRRRHTVSHTVWTRSSESVRGAAARWRSCRSLATVIGSGGGGGGGGGEFAELGSTADELEMDYYDYDVTNAGHVTGSLFAPPLASLHTAAAAALQQRSHITGGATSGGGSCCWSAEVAVELSETPAAAGREEADGSGGASDDSPRSGELISRLTDTVTLSDLTYVDDSDSEDRSPRLPV